MYYKHFNLSGYPFQFTPSAGVFYPSASHQEALAALEWGLLYEPSAATMIIGEPSTGKTTLISSVLARSVGNARIAYIPNPQLSFDEILQLVARQFGIAFDPSRRLAQLDALDQFLEVHRSERVTLIIDEAQAIPDGLIEELRLLSNCPAGRENSLRVVFIGQPEFARRLESPELRALNERIGARAVLSPLQPEEIFEYIDFRLRAWRGRAKDVFSRSALRHIADNSDGIPRRINIFCHNAMLLAYSDRSRQVAASHAQAAVAEFKDLRSTGACDPIAEKSIKRGRRGAWQTVAATVTAVRATHFWTPKRLHLPDGQTSTIRPHQGAA